MKNALPISLIASGYSLRSLLKQGCLNNDVEVVETVCRFKC